MSPVHAGHRPDLGEHGGSPTGGSSNTALCPPPPTCWGQDSSLCAACSLPLRHPQGSHLPPPADTSRLQILLGTQFQICSCAARKNVLLVVSVLFFWFGHHLFFFQCVQAETLTRRDGRSWRGGRGALEFLYTFVFQFVVSLMA